MISSAHTSSASTHDNAMETFHGDMDVEDDGNGPHSQVLGHHAPQPSVFQNNLPPNLHPQHQPMILGPQAPQVANVVPLSNSGQLDTQWQDTQVIHDPGIYGSGATLSGPQVDHRGQSVGPVTNSQLAVTNNHLHVNHVHPASISVSPTKKQMREQGRILED